MKVLYLFALLLALGACTLNSDQEQALNRSLKEYIDARNGGFLVVYTGFTHPNALDYYLEQGDEEFKERFDLTPNPKSFYLQDGTVRETEWDGDNIHVRYEFVGVNEYDLSLRSKIFSIYAISIDDGASWHFIDKIDYMNDKIISPKYRLIKN